MGINNLLLAIWLNAAFNELVTSENYTEFAQKDRVRLVFHWTLFRGFRNYTDDSRNEILERPKKN